MINQRAYPDILLGFSQSLTVASHGCYMTAILQALWHRGYSYTVREWNDLLKSSGVYTEKNPTLLAASVMPTCLPKIFEAGRNESWNDANLVKYLNDPTYFVIGEVSGKGIGGSGQHFVLIDRVDTKPDGKISMTYIDDPWGGLEDQKVTTRYNAFGNILSFRVFKVKLKSSTGNGGNMANMYKGYDLANPESMKIAVDVLVRLQSGDLVDKSKYDELQNMTAKKISEAEKKGFDKGYAEGYAKGKSETGTAPAPAPKPTIIPADFEVNGVQTKEVIDGVEVVKNYARKG